jgi:ABC-type uncharacterized transport system ATPase subunit
LRKAVQQASHLTLMAAVEPVIAVENLVKVYKTTRAVDGISFALEPGSVTGLLGGNGAGKTTTIAMILGLYHADVLAPRGSWGWHAAPKPTRCCIG